MLGRKINTRMEECVFLSVCVPACMWLYGCVWILFSVHVLFCVMCVHVTVQGRWGSVSASVNVCAVGTVHVCLPGAAWCGALEAGGWTAGLLLKRRLQRKHTHKHTLCNLSKEQAICFPLLADLMLSCQDSVYLNLMKIREEQN